MLKGRIRGAFDLIPANVDPGLIMNSAVHVDVEASLESYRRFHAGWPQAVDAAAREIERLKAEFVFTNVSYLALAGAARAEVPCVSMSSINWADVFEHYCSDYPGSDAIVGQIRAGYACADLFLALTPGMPMPEMPRLRYIGPVAARGREQAMARFEQALQRTTPVGCIHDLQVGLRILAEIKDKRLFQIASRLRQDENPYVREMAGRVVEETQATMDTGLLSAVAVAGLDRKQLRALLARFAVLEPADRTREVERLFEKMSPRQRLEFLKPFTAVIRKPLALEMTEFLIGRLKDPDPGIRRLAVEALPVSVCHMEMMEILKDSDPTVAATAAKKLCSLELPTVARHALPVSLKNPDPRARSMAYYNLEKAYHKPSLLMALKDDSFHGRSTARYIASKHLDDLDVCRALIAIIGRPEELPPGAPSDEKVITALCKDCEQAAGTQKRVLLTFIARSPSPAATAYVRQCRSSPDRDVRWTAMEALARRGDKAVATLDFALSRVLVSESSFSSSPYRDLICKELLARLETFNQLVPADRLDVIRRDIQSGLARREMMEQRSKRP